MQVIAGSTEHAVRVNDIELHYLEWGDAAAPPLVLLHGLTGHAHIWDQMARQLAARYRLLVPDQRGHGDSGHAASYRTGDYTSDLEALIAHWGLGSFALCGLSMGGHNSIAYAAAHPERVTTLCVIDIPPAPVWSGAFTDEEATALLRDGHPRYANFEAAYAEARRGNTTAPDDKLRYRAMLNVRPDADGSVRWKHDARAEVCWDPANLWKVLPQITAPVLIVRAGLNPYLTPEMAERMASAIGGQAEIVEVATSGHSVPTDKPELLAPILLDWLSRHEG